MILVAIVKSINQRIHAFLMIHFLSYFLDYLSMIDIRFEQSSVENYPA